MRLSKYLYFFVLKYFGVRFKTNSAVLLLKTKNKESKDRSCYLLWDIFKENKGMHTIYIKKVLPIKFITFMQKKILERPFN